MMQTVHLRWLAPMLVLAVARPALAADRTWNRTIANPGTNWADSAYWTGGVPGTNDRAVFPGIAADDTCRPALSNGATVAIKGIYLNGNYSTVPTWRIRNADSSAPATLVLGAGGITNRFRCGGTDGFNIYPNIRLATNQLWQIDPDYGDSGPNLYGDLAGPGRLTRGGFCGYGETRYNRRASPTFSGGLNVERGTLRWNQLNLTAADAGVYTFGSGPITLGGGGQVSPNGGGFVWACTALTGNDGFVMDLASAITVNGIGQLRYEQNGGTGYRPNCRFSGPVTLNGSLRIFGANSVGLMPRYEGNITLDQARWGVPGLSKGDSSGDGYNPQYYDGNVADGPGPAVKPLVLQCQANAFGLRGAANTYAGGTVVSWCGDMMHGAWQGAYVTIPAGTVLGTGPLAIEPGGRLRLAEAANLGAAARVTLQRNESGMGTLALGYDGLPAVSAESEGAIAIDAAAYTAITNLAGIGNGACFLGTRANGTFTGTTLAPGAGGTYRLGGGNHGGNTLTVTPGVLTGAAGLQVGQSAWFGNGIVRLNGANSFTGDIDVIGMLVCGNGPAISYIGSTLEGNAQAAAGASPFGAPAGAVTVHGSALRLYGVAGGQPAVKAQLTVDGFSRVIVDSTSANRATTLQVAGLTRLNRGVLQVNPYYHRLGGNEKLVITNQADSAFLPPYIVFHSGNGGGTAVGPDFATYDATGATGVGRFTAYVPMPDPGTGTEIVSHTNVVTGAPSIRALKTTGAISGTGPLSIGDGTHGGVILGGNVAIPLSFGTSEALVYNAGACTISGKISGSGGFTKTGTGDLTLSSTANDFTGLVTVQGGTLKVDLDSATGTGSLGDLENDLYLNGANLQRNAAGDRLAASRTITLGPCGAYMMGQSYGTLTLYGRITGPGFLAQLQSGASYVIAGSGNDYSGGTWVSYGAVTVNNGSTLGTGDVNVGQTRTLTVAGNDGIDAHARLNVALTGLAIFQSAAPVIGSLGGSGNVRLGTASVSSALTVGGDDSSFTFLGDIYPFAAAQPGSLTKTGSGTFTLYGNHTFTGATTVSQGTLRLMGSLAGNCTVDPGATLGGTGGRIAGSLDVNGTWNVELRGDADGDRLVCGGALDIAGAALTVSAADAYVPTVGTTWTIATGATSITGTFASVPPGYSVSAPGDGTLVLRKPPSSTLLMVR